MGSDARREALLERWRGEAPKRRRGALGAKGCVLLLVAAPIPIAAVLLMVAPSLVSGDAAGLGVGVSFAMLVTAIGAFLAAVAVARRPTRRLLKAIEKGQAKEEKPPEASLTTATVELCAVLGVSPPRVFFVHGALYVSPYVALIDKRDALVIPAGFIGLWRAREPEARAILAHELAHIAQRDLSSWGLVGAANRVIASLLALKALDFVVAAATAQTAGGGIGFLAGVLFFWRLRRTRAASECTADLAAAGAVSPDAIRAAIRLFRTPRLSVFGEHPSRAVRLRQLERYCRTVQSAAGA